MVDDNGIMPVIPANGGTVTVVKGKVIPRDPVGTAVRTVVATVRPFPSTTTTSTFVTVVITFCRLLSCILGISVVARDNEIV